MAQIVSPWLPVIRNLEDRRYQAVLDQDYDTFESMCHPELIYGHTGGNRDSLGTYMAKLRSGALRYSSIDHPVENIVLIGKTALVIGKMLGEVCVDGDKKSLRNSTLAVWTMDDAKWTLLAYQPTPLA